jgi:hypothetical protein
MSQNLARRRSLTTTTTTTTTTTSTMSTVDTAATEVVVATSMDEALDHPAFAVLNSRKAGLSLQDKRDVLKALLAHVRHSHFETETLEAHPIKTFIDDHRRIKTTNQTQRLVAEALMKYHFFLQVNKVNKRKKRRASSRPTTSSTASTEATSAQAKLSRIIKECENITKGEKLVAKSKKARLPSQTNHANHRYQDVAAFDDEKRDFQPCPGCNHLFVMEVWNPKTTNDKLKIDWDAATAAWMAAPVKGRKKEPPRRPASKSGKLACYCLKQHCLNSVTGRGCGACHAELQLGNALKIKDGKCMCSVCNCTCSLVFNHEGRDKIARDTAEKQGTVDWCVLL